MLWLIKLECFVPGNIFWDSTIFVTEEE
jgi:hypothetical protein